MTKSTNEKWYLTKSLKIYVWTKREICVGLPRIHLSWLQSRISWGLKTAQNANKVQMTLKIALSLSSHSWTAWSFSKHWGTRIFSTSSWMRWRHLRRCFLMCWQLLTTCIWKKTTLKSLKFTAWFPTLSAISTLNSTLTVPNLFSMS